MSVILIVADGTGFAHYSTLLQNHRSRRIFKRFPRTILVNTAPPSSYRQHKKCIDSDHLRPVTESASSATAMSTGRWVPPGYIATDHSGRRLKTITEHIRDRYDIGLICTTEFSDATPAAFFAHSDDRSRYEHIAEQVLAFGLSVMVSGGERMAQLIRHAYLLPRFSKLLSEKEWVDHNTRGVHDVAKHLTTVVNKQLQKPFFLLVEESNVDKASHNEDVKQTTCELTSLVNTVDSALKYVEDAENETTLILISDHSTGAATVKDKNERYSQFTLGSGDHDGHIVPMFMAGHACHDVMPEQGLLDMVDVYKILKQLTKRT